MSTKVPVDLATPQITEPMETPEEMVTAGNDTITKVSGSPALAGGGAPEVAAAIKLWQPVITALDTNNKSKAAGKQQVALAEAAEPALVRRFRVRRNVVLSAVQSEADGAAQGVQSFNLEVEQRIRKPVATVPSNLRPMKTKTPSTASARWDMVLGAKGYLLQHTTNTADPTTFSQPISVSGTRYHLGGQAPGTTVYFRVLACDGRILPNGQTAYTTWVPVVVAG